MSMQVVPQRSPDVVPNPEAAFKNKGVKAAVFRPRFGQAHQQYFTPKWITQASADIAEALYQVAYIDGERGGYPLRVLDPTCGSGRLLAPFASRGHQVMGIELDDRLVPVARRAVGKANVRQSDVCAYASVIPMRSFDVAVINPPYGLWWPVDETLRLYELASKENIESQKMVLEMVTGLLWSNYDQGGLLIALMSGKFWTNNPKAMTYVKQNFQIIANLTLPKPYKPEYGIDVDSALLVAYRVNRHFNQKKPAPLTGTFDSQDPQELAQAVVKAYEANLGRKSRWHDVRYLPKKNYDRSLPDVPELDMAVSVETGKPKAKLNAKGLQASDDWAGAWAAFYESTPLETYNQAEGTNTDMMQAFTALPNILINGADSTLDSLTSLGFDVEIADKGKDRIERAAARYQRDRLPVRELSPMEYLAWYEDGPITAEEDVSIPRATKQGRSVEVISGMTYELQVRWERNSKQVGQGEEKGKGSKSYVLRKYIDRGYLTFHFTAPDGTRFKVREIDPEQIEAMVDAFGLPDVDTVQDLPHCERKSWAVQLDRLIEKMAARNGGLRPYKVQREDILRMATKSSVALLYEMGGGKTMVSAFWAALRGFERVLMVTPASVVPGIIEDLTKWGFKVHDQPLSHSEVSNIKAAKRAGEKPEETTFWIASYESMGLQSGSYDAWSHPVYDNEGNYQGEHDGNHGAKCDHPGCSVSRSSVVKACPKCGASGDDWRSIRGSNRGGGRVCRKCGYRAWSAGTLKPATDEREAVKGRRMAPIGPRIKRLFSCVILDEVQDAKSKGSLKGETTRALKAKGKAVLSGTWLKGYVTDLFWSAGWLLGFGSPLWPFPYNGGSARFLEQFGTFEYVTKEYANTLQTGKRKLIPSVSNLGRMWRLLSPFTVRRLKEDSLKDLPPKHKEVHWTTMVKAHRHIYRRVEEAMQDTLKRELQKSNPSMGVISMALWWGRYAAGCPTQEGAPHYAGAYGTRIKLSEASRTEIKAVVDQMKLQGAVLPQNLPSAKVSKAMELIWKIQKKGEKVIVFTSLRGLYSVMERELKRKGVGYTGMDGVPTKKRNDVARRFEDSTDTVLLAGTGTLNRGVTINGANHVIILNTEWSPETTLQAEDRCHRPGQEKEVYVHYILAAGTIEQEMWKLLNQKHAAQRAVFDKEAQVQSVEDVMAEAVSAQMQVAKAMVEIEREPIAEIEAEPEAAPEPESVERLTVGDLFKLQGRKKVSYRQRKRKVDVPEQQLNFMSVLQPAG